jgi:hypothetical protein
METFNIELFEGHPIIESGNDRILVDTGSPSTIHITESIEFCGRTYSVSTSLMGFTPQSVSGLLGTEITTLMGADILIDFGILFNYQARRIEFYTNDIRLDGNEIGIRNFMGIPIVEASIDGQMVNCFLDTGARLSYLPGEITSGYPRLGVEEDFFPVLGKFETDCFGIETRIDGRPFMVRYGNLPAILQMTLMLGGAQGVIGYDFFNSFEIALDLAKNRLSFR